MVDTIKFSQMTAGGDLDNDKKTPGLKDGGNVLFNNPWTFLPPGTTAGRPTPAPAMYNRLRFNTDDQVYEYYDSVSAMWTQLAESSFIFGPIVTYDEDFSIPGAQNLGLLGDGILKQTVTSGAATVDIALSGTDYWAPGDALTRTQAPTVGDDVTNKTYVDAEIAGVVTPSPLTKVDDTNVTLTLGGTPSTALLESVSITAGWAGLLAIARGGTGVGSVTTSPTATAFSGWDANKNLSANSHIDGFTTTVTAASTTVLTVASTKIQEFTGSTTQTVTMPVTSTLVAGQTYTIINNSSGTVTVQSSGANSILVMAGNSTAEVTCVVNSGTGASSWNATYIFDSGGGSGGLASFQVFTSGTAQTYNTPAGISSLIVEVVGAGGGGGGSTGGVASVSVGAAGAAGGYSMLFIPSASASYTYTVGAGGTAGTAGGGTGGTGGTTTFSASSLQATGGGGGTGMGAITTASRSLGGAGGVGSNGTVNTQGAAGGSGLAVSGVVFSGVAGSSHYGGGANSVTLGAGNAGGNYGSGGSGGVSTVSDAAGGAGSGGLIVVWEFR